MPSVPARSNGLPSRRVHARASRGTRAPRRVRAALVALAGTALSLLTPLALPAANRAAAATPPACGSAGTPSVVALADPHFYVDTSLSPQLLAGYAGYTVNAGSAARSHLWLALDGFTGGVVHLAAGQPAAQALPRLASGATSTQYFLLAADGTTATPQTHTITLYDGRPGAGTPVCSRTFTYADVVDTIKALANKVTGLTSTASPDTATIGSTVTVTVTGNTGTLGAGPANDPGVLSYTPDVLADFPASAWRLVRTELTVSPDGSAPAQTYVDQLRLAGASGAARPYTATYTFLAVGPTSRNATVQPVQYIASGTQVKHTDTGSTVLYALPDVSPIGDVAVSRTVTSPADGIVAAGGGTVSHRLVLTNSAAASRQVDAVVETLPAGASYVAGSLTLDGHPVADPTTTGGTVEVDGPIDVPAGGRTVLTFDEQVDATPGTRTSSAVAYFGTVQVDGSRDVTASDPVTASVRVLGTAGPAAADDAATTAANTAVTVDVLANDTSPSGLPLSVTGIATAPTHGSAEVTADGRVAYTPANNFSGTDSFRYAVSDGRQSATGTVTVTVTPGASNDIYATGKGVTLSATTSVLANDACTGCTATLVSGPTFTTSTGGSAAGGTLTLNADGTFGYVPPAGTVGTATFTYRAAGGTGSATATVTVNVNDLAPDYATTAGGTSVDIDVKANDPGCSNSGCKPQAGTAPAHGTADYTVVTPKVRYTPATGFWGIDAFSYGVTGSTGSTTTPVHVLVGPPALALTTSYGHAVSASLPAGGSCDGCTYLGRTPPTHGTVTVDPGTGALTYAPADGFAGTDTFDYRVADPATGLRVTGTVSVTVGPRAGDDSVPALAGTPLTAHLGDNDDCPATCTWTLGAGAPAGMTLAPGTGVLTWTPPTTAIGPVALDYTVSSSVAPSYVATGHVTVHVAGAVDDTATTQVATPVTVDVLANDPCTDCALDSVAAPAVGTAAVVDGAVRYTPPAGFSGVDSVVYTVRDAAGTSTATLTVTVMPQAVDDDVTVVEGQGVQLLPLDNDLCSGCVVTSVGPAANGDTSLDGDVVSYTPHAGVTGDDSFRYDVADAAGNAAHALVHVHVVAAPQLADDTAAVDGDGTVAVDVLGNDACTGCTVTVDTDPAHGTATVDVSGRVRYAPAPGYTGPDSLRYAATDPATGARATATVDLDVRPVAADDTVRTPVGTPVTVDVLANDVCTACTVDVASAPANGSAALTADGIAYSPAAGFSGADAVGYRVTDPATGDTATATVHVDVNDAAPDAATTTPGAPVTVDVLGNDLCAGCTVDSATPADPASSADVTWSGGDVTFTPAAGFWGLAVLGYRASAGEVGVASTLRVLVAPADRTLTTQAGQQTTGPAVGSGCDGCTVTLTTPPQDGDLDLDATGFAYTPAAGSSSDAFDYRITDPQSGLHVPAHVALVAGSTDTGGTGGTGGSTPPAPAAQTITFDPVPDTTYSAGTVAIAPTASSGLPVVVDSATPDVCAVDLTGTKVALGDVGTCTLVATQPGDEQWLAADPVTRSFTIAPDTQSVSFDALPDVPLATGSVLVSAAADSGLPVTFEAGPADVCTAEAGLVALHHAGACAVTASQAGDRHWSPATSVTRTFQVTPDPQTIDVVAPASLAADADPVTLQTTATSGLPVSWTTSTPDVCALDGAVVTPLAPGTCTLVATQDGDGDWQPADPVTLDLTVTAPVAHAVDDRFRLPLSVAFAGPVRLDVSGNDGAGLTVVAVSQPDRGGSVALRDGDVWFRTAAGFAGTATFGYVTENARHLRSTATVRVVVPDAPPTVSVGNARTVAGTPVTVPVRSGDPNGDRLTVHVVTVGSATTAPVSGGLRFAPGATRAGRLPVRVTVTDPAGRSATATGWVTVAPQPVPRARHHLNGAGTTIGWTRSATGHVRYRVDVDGAPACVTTAAHCAIGTPVGPRARVTVTVLGPDGTSSTRTVSRRTAGRPDLLTVVHFATARWDLSATARARIDAVAARASALGFTVVRAIGYTDSRGSAAYNLALSRHRVLAVAERVRSRQPRLRVATGWQGLTHPVRSNTTAIGRAANRRVELWVT